LQIDKKEHGNYPARLVVHKTSRFHPKEREGFQKAIEQSGDQDRRLHLDAEALARARVPQRRLSTPARHRDAPRRRTDRPLYPRQRRLLPHLSGMYVPNPMVLHAQRRDTPDWNLLLKETLALTKMNWSGTQFDSALPITLKAARQVGDILKYVPDGTIPDPRYRFYM